MSRAESNKELYEFLKTCLDDKGIPVMNNPTFDMVTNKYGKEVFRSTLAEYITKEKPPYPFKEWEEEKRSIKFDELSNYDYRKFIMPEERHKDDFKKHGIGIINGSALYNYISDSFMNKERLHCGSYGFKAAATRWEQGDNIWGALGAIWRRVNKSKDFRKELSHKTYEMTFRLGTYIATQFKPTVAKAIYDMTNAKTVPTNLLHHNDRYQLFFYRLFFS